jgi:hypothetical protein
MSRPMRIARDPSTASVAAITSVRAMLSLPGCREVRDETTDPPWGTARGWGTGRELVLVGAAFVRR